MAVNSRDKGKRGELELAEELRKFGYDARRGQQFKGGADSPDVVCAGLEDFHIEAKRVERTDLYGWMAQAQRDAAEGKTPIVAHKKNRKGWLVIMTLEDFLARTLLIGTSHG